MGRFVFWPTSYGPRGASWGSVWLSWQVPFYHRYSALKPIKYQSCHCRSLMWVVWNRLQPAFAFQCCIILLRKNNVPALSKWRLCNDTKQFTFLNTLNWYCIERMYFRISSSGSSNSNASKTVIHLYTAMHTQSCFVIFRFMARRCSVQSRSFCFAVLA